MSNRVKKLTYQSPMGVTGRPRYFLPGVPTRDLEEEDIELLSPEDYETVKAAKMPDGNPLYTAPKPAAAPKQAKKTSSAATAKRAADEERQAAEHAVQVADELGVSVEAQPER